MSYLSKKNGRIRCFICQRSCELTDNQVGFCLARQNIGGKIESLLYGQITGIQVDPIEKKPFYHFKPGSLVATIGSYGCNFRCKQCLNYDYSWGKTATQTLSALKSPTSHPHNSTLLSLPTHTSPSQIAQTIIDSGYQGIAFSYNEPVIWAEFAADIAQEFKMHFSESLNPYPLSGPHIPNRFAVFVTNGSWTKETIDLLTSATGDAKRGLSPTARNGVSTGGGAASDRTRCQLIDAANIDLKGFSEETYKKMGACFNIIPEMAIYAKKKGIFLELTTLLIPTINDNPDELKKITSWIAKNLGPDISWHLSQYDPTLAPDKEFQKIPFTTVEELEKAAEIGKKEGLNHIYIWAPSSNYSRSDTICPKCHKAVIKRSGWQPAEINILPPNLCQFCQYKLNIIL